MPETITHMGREIELPQGGNGFRFRVRDEDRSHADFKTIEAARKAIEDDARASAVKLALDCLLEDGTRVTVTGINRQNGGFLGLPRDHFYRPGVWVNVPAAAAALADVRRLEKEREEAEKRARRFKLTPTSGQKSPERHLQLLEELRAKYAEIAAGEAVDAVEEVS